MGWLGLRFLYIVMCMYIVYAVRGMKFLRFGFVGDLCCFGAGGGERKVIRRERERKWVGFWPGAVILNLNQISVLRQSPWGWLFVEDYVWIR